MMDEKLSLRYPALLFSFLFLVCQPLTGRTNETPSAEEIIQRTENNLYCETAVLDLTMEVITPHTSRKMRFTSYSKGKKKSFIRINYPGKDEGITFLRISGQMWQYVPRIERIIKIPASMMLQSWMGSDFTNDDLVRESSIADDYHQRLLGVKDNEFIIELLPREKAPVVWGKIVMRISQEYYLPTRAAYYDEEGTLIRTLFYEEIKSFDGHHYPAHWRLIPRTGDKEGHKTIIHIDQARFNEEIDNNYFSKRALKRFSR